MFDSPYCTTTVSLCIYKRLFQWYISTSVLYLISALGIVCMSLCWCYHCISHRYELELHFTIRNVLQHSFPWHKCIPFISSYSENSTECKRLNLWLYFPFFFAAPESGAWIWAAAWTLWRNPRATWRINWAQYKTSTNRTLANWRSSWLKPKAAPKTCRNRYKQPKTTQTFYWNSAAKMHNTFIIFIQQGCIKID